MSGCRTSKAPATLAAEESPLGAYGTVVMNGGASHHVELLAAGERSLVVLRQERIAIAPFANVHHVAFDDDGSIDIGASFGLHLLDLEKLRNRSRFPYGVSSSLMAALLRVSKQRAPDTLNVSAP